MCSFYAQTCVHTHTRAATQTHTPTLLKATSQINFNHKLTEIIIFLKI